MDPTHRRLAIGRPSIFRLVAGMLLVNLFVFGVAAYSLYQSKNQHEQRVAIQTQNLSESVGNTIVSILEKASVALFAVKKEMERQIVSGGVDSASLNRYIEEGATLIPELDGLRIVNAAGIFVYGDAVVSGAPTSVADRDYFRQVRDNPEPDLIISQPLLARSSNKWVFNVVRRIDNPDGSFAGAVIGAISLEYIRHMFSSFDLGKDGVLTLRDGNMAVMVRQPEVPGGKSSIGNRVLSPQLTALFEAGKTSGTYKNPGSIDTVARTFSFNKIANYPLYITVGLATADYLAPWRTEAAIMMALLFVFSVGSLVSTIVVYKGQKRKAAAEAGLLQYRDSLEETVRQRTSELEEKNAQLSTEIALRKQAGDDLRKAAIIMDRMSDAVEWISREGRLVYVNDAACTMHGYPPEELLTMKISQVAPEFSAEKWEDHWDQLKREGSLHFETVNRRCGGAEFPVEVKASFLSIDGVEYNCALVRDISERKEAEAEKQNLLMQLTQSQKIESIGRLAGGIAHDFNNLLMPILGYADLLKTSFTPESREYGRIDCITQAATKAKVLTHQLLSFGRKQILEMKTVDINAVITEFYQIFRRTIRENIDIRINLSSGGYSIRADKNQIEQIILNLAINAQDAIDDKGVITIETAPMVLDEEYARCHPGVTPGNYVMLAVTDSGSGISQETLEHIFEPFFTTKAVGKGSGLGLATVYGLVKQHGGHLWVYSEIGKGSVFKVYFPAIEDPPATDAATEAQPEVMLTDCSILLVEDDIMVRDLVSHALAINGCKVIVAEGPKDAILKCNSQPIHLLLTDVVMPEINGPELHKRLLAMSPGLKVLYMSGYTNNVIVHHGVLEEGINFIQKPFALHALMTKIATVLRD